MAMEDIKRLLILASFFLLVFLLFFFLFWRPRTGNLERHKADIVSKKTVLLQLKQDIDDWPPSFTHDIMQTYRGDMDRLWNLIPSEEEAAMLLGDIEAQVTAAKLKLLHMARITTAMTTFEFGQASGKGKTQYIRMPYKITLGGDYFGLIKFLRELENAERLVTVTNIVLSAGQEDYPMDADIQFNIFYSKAEVTQVEG